MQNCLCGAKEEWGVEADHKLEKSKQLHTLPSLYPILKDNIPGDRMCKLDLKRSISVSPNPQDSLAVLLVQLRERVLRVQTLRTHLSNHQTPLSSSLTASAAGTQNSHLLGQLAFDYIRSCPQGPDSTRNQGLY